jgi:hypothetical protein
MPAPATTPAPQPRPWRIRCRNFCVRLTVYWVLYTLSIGPMFWWWFEASYLDGPKWIFVFYLPLLVACEYIGPFGDFVNWYINLWIL